MRAIGMDGDRRGSYEASEGSVFSRSATPPRRRPALIIKRFVEAREPDREDQ
jgi:hypothetical protein